MVVLLGHLFSHIDRPIHLLNDLTGQVIEQDPVPPFSTMSTDDKQVIVLAVRLGQDFLHYQSVSHLGMRIDVQLSKRLDILRQQFSLWSVFLHKFRSAGPQLSPDHAWSGAHL